MAVHSHSGIAVSYIAVIARDKRAFEEWLTHLPDGASEAFVVITPRAPHGARGKRLSGFIVLRRNVSAVVEHRLIREEVLPGMAWLDKDGEV